MFCFFKLWRPGFDLWSLHVTFLVDKVALRQVLLPVRRLPHHYHSTSSAYSFTHPCHCCCVILATCSIKESGLVICGTTFGWVVPVVSRIVGPLSALHSSETQCTGHIVTWCHIPEHWTLQQHHCENLKSCHCKYEAYSESFAVKKNWVRFCIKFYCYHSTFFKLFFHIFTAIIEAPIVAGH